MAKADKPGVVASGLKKIDLGGEWMLRPSDGQRGNPRFAEQLHTDEVKYFKATVPGSVHLDLMRAGLIQEPALGLNSLSCRWVEECHWHYRRFFEVPAEALKGRSWLYFEGLDLAARVVLNGVEIGSHENAFLPYRVECTGQLKAGSNLLTVHLESGLWAAADKNGSDYAHQMDGRLHKRHWLRKAQYQFGWDWTTRLINIGIFKPVTFEYTAQAVRIDQFVVAADLDASLKTGRVRGRLFVEGLGDRTVDAVMELKIPGLKATAKLKARVEPGMQVLEAVLAVKAPKLWWPRGQGAQNRYEVTAYLKVKGKMVGERSCKVGFRHVRFRQDPHPQAGRYFLLELNNKPVFAKGGNFVPADIIPARIDAARYETLVQRAIEANFNFLRVWGGGLYEAEEFYEICDREGILVWQEFIFACSKYPTTDKAFFDNVMAEARYQARRLASRPSLIAWCGNNENEAGTWDWGWEKKGAVLPDHALYHVSLPKMLAAEDPGRYYQPSSPFSPDMQPPNLDLVGDQHPWSIGFGDNDFRKYRLMECRFANEGGILGPTALPTVEACLPEGQRFSASFAWQHHDNSIDSWFEPSAPDKMLLDWLGLDIRSLGLKEFVYWGGVLQGEGLREYCENFRRRFPDSGAAIFWMFNDSWPATRSWTIVDYYLRRCPSFHPVRRALAPLHVALAENNGELLVYGMNDTLKPVVADLSWGIFAFAGKVVREKRLKVRLAANASTLLAKMPMKVWKDAQGQAAFAQLSQGKKLLARNRLILPLFKDLKLKPSALTVRVEKGEAIFESPVFEWAVCLDLEGEEALADNFFDVYPGKPYRIPWKKLVAPQVLFVGNNKP